MGHHVWGVLVTCGKDEQLTADTDVGFVSLGSKPALMYSLLAFEKCPEIDGVVVVCRKERMETLVGMISMFGANKVRKVVAGGTSRKASLQNGLAALDEDVSIVSIHEGSRPFISASLISESIKSAKRYGCGIAALKITDPVKETERGLKVTGGTSGQTLWALQKPQTYKRDVLEKGLAAGAKKKAVWTDESDLLPLIRKSIHLVPSVPSNIRIESTEDLEIATCLLSVVN